MMATIEEQEVFMQRMGAAIEIAKQKGATLNTLAVLAQAALESAWGTSYLTRIGNNLFGIKWGFTKTDAYVELPTYEWDPVKSAYYRAWARFTSYASYNECLVEYSRLLVALPWFSDALKHADPGGLPSQWIAALEEPGKPDWATSPYYIGEVATVGRFIARSLGKTWA